jgi:hypothetical protein
MTGSCPLVVLDTVASPSSALCFRFPEVDDWSRCFRFVVSEVDGWSGCIGVVVTGGTDGKPVAPDGEPVATDTDDGGVGGVFGEGKINRFGCA